MHLWLIIRIIYTSKLFTVLLIIIYWYCFIKKKSKLLSSKNRFLDK